MHQENHSVMLTAGEILKKAVNLLFIDYSWVFIEKRGPIENLSGALDYRLEVIESNLSRVCNQ